MHLTMPQWWNKSWDNRFDRRRPDRSSQRAEHQQPSATERNERKTNLFTSNNAYQMKWKKFEAIRSKYPMPGSRSRTGEENKSACDSDLTKRHVMWLGHGIRATTVRWFWQTVLREVHAAQSGWRPKRHAEPAAMERSARLLKRVYTVFSTVFSSASMSFSGHGSGYGKRAAKGDTAYSIGSLPIWTEFRELHV